MPLTNTIGTAAARSYGFLTKSGIGGLVIFYTNSGGNINANVTSNINVNSSETSFYNIQAETSNYPTWYIFSSSSSGTIGYQKRVYTFGTSNYGGGSYLDASNNLLALGTDYGQISGGYLPPATIYKFDSSGALSWRSGRVWSNGYIKFNACGVDSSGNIYIVGSIELTSFTYFYIAKYNSSGVYQFEYAIGTGVTGNNYYFADCVVDSSGNTYAVGGYGYSSTSITKCAIVKFPNTANGYTWAYRLYDAVAQSYVFTSISTDNTYFYVSGYTYNGSIYESLYCKYDTSGSMYFQKRIYTTTSVFINKSIYNSGYVYLVGYVTVSGKNNALILKMNTSGNIIWQKMIATSVALNCKNITIDASNFVIDCSISTTPTKLVKIVLPISNNITGTFAAGGYTFTCSDASVSIATSTYTSGSLTFNASYPNTTAQTTFTTIQDGTSITSTSTPI